MTVIRVRSDRVRPFLMDAIERPIIDPLWKEKAKDSWIGRRETEMRFPDMALGMALCKSILS